MHNNRFVYDKVHAKHDLLSELIRIAANAIKKRVGMTYQTKYYDINNNIKHIICKIIYGDRNG